MKVVHTLGTILLLGAVTACATTSNTRADVAMLPTGEYRLSATVSVRNDTEFQERVERHGVEAVLTVGEAGALTLSADSGPCVETTPSIDLRRPGTERRFDCGASLFAIEGRGERLIGTVTQQVDNFERWHSGCRRMIRQNERDVCVEDAYTVVHRRRPQTAELKTSYVERRP